MRMTVPDTLCVRGEVMLICMTMMMPIINPRTPDAIIWNQYLCVVVVWVCCACRLYCVSDSCTATAFILRRVTKRTLLVCELLVGRHLRICVFFRTTSLRRPWVSSRYGGGVLCRSVRLGLVWFDSTQQGTNRADIILSMLSSMVCSSPVSTINGMKRRHALVLL